MMLEHEMTGPIGAWFEKMGFTWFTEVPEPGSGSYGFVDVVGFHEMTETIVAVEMKRSMTGHLITQASHHKNWADMTYVAVPTRPRKLPQWPYEDMGVLRVTGSVEVCRDAVVTRHWDSFVQLREWRQRVLWNLRNMPPGGVGGVKTEVGVGAAIECVERVREYKERHPAATWKEIFANVWNHYGSASSMASALRDRI